MIANFYMQSPPGLSVSFYGGEIYEQQIQQDSQSYIIVYFHLNIHLLITTIVGREFTNYFVKNYLYQINTLPIMCVMFYIVDTTTNVTRWAKTQPDYIILILRPLEHIR